MGYLVGLANVLMVLTSLFLICLILIQRGKGGGLAGAFGGVGGSSAFGTKAGDVFTKVTIWVAIVWFALAICLVWSSNWSRTSAFAKGVTADSAADELPGAKSSDKDKDKVKDKDAGSAPIEVPPLVPKVPKSTVETSTETKPDAPSTKPDAPSTKPETAPVAPEKAPEKKP